jgi:hypothetical protein
VNHLLGLANRACQQQLEPFGGVVVAAGGVVQVVAAPLTVTRHTSRGGEQPRPRITVRRGCAATKPPPSLDRHVRPATLATTKKAEASAMASQEEAGHVDAPCEWWDSR